MSDPEGPILTIIPCPHPLTTVELRWDGPLHDKAIAHYYPIVAIMYRYPFREKMEHYDGEDWWLPPSVQYSTDYELFRSHPGNHQTTEDGGCACISSGRTGVSRKKLERCRLFGMFNKTPEELKADPQLTDDITRRIVYVKEAIIRAEEQKKIKKERGRIYAQRAKEKKLAKQAAAAANVISEDGFNNRPALGGPVMRDGLTKDEYRQDFVKWLKESRNVINEVPKHDHSA